MSFISIFALVLLIASKLMMLNLGEVYYILSQFFPEVAEKFVHTMYLISKQSDSFNLFFVILAFYFSKDLFVALVKAFSYITQGYQKQKRNVYIMIFSLPVVVLIITLIYLLKFLINFFLTYFMSGIPYLEILFGKEITNKIHTTLIYIREVLSFGVLFEFTVLFMFILFAYRLLIETKSITKTQVVYVSVLVSVLILVLKAVFGVIYGVFLTKSPLFAVMGSIFIVIVWVKMMFDMILIGGRLIYYLEKASQRGGLV